jgi:predicted anti-sigma-YlaC factor YlaD
MKQWPVNHLTADDLDAFHSASLSVHAREHLAECEECRTMAHLDRAVLAALATLPSYAPAPQFADRVLARVERPEPALVRLLAQRSPAAWGRRALAASVVLGLGASIVWSLLNRELLLSWIHLSAAETGRSLWLGVRVVVANVTEQPWYAPLREFASSPGRLAALVSGSLVTYAAALVALRRLLTPPSRPVPNATW